MNEPARPAAPVLLEAVGLTKIYSSQASSIVIFQDLGLQIRLGELIAVVGPSGAGKSTLLHLLGGLDRPTSGQVFFQGKDIFQMGPNALAEYRNRHIGFVFQFHHLLPEFTAVENAAMPLIVRGMARQDAHACGASVLNRVGLGRRLDHRVGELSGGEQQRVAIARALVGDAQLLLADEPTGNLDPATGRAVFDVVRELHRERRLTSLVVTHNEQIALRCDQVWEIQDGCLREFSSSLP